MTMPAPPPYGVSSTWPAVSGVEARRSTKPSWCPSASAFRTWRCWVNHSNQPGKSVTTSIFIRGIRGSRGSRRCRGRRRARRRRRTGSASRRQARGRSTTVSRRSAPRCPFRARSVPPAPTRATPPLRARPRLAGPRRAAGAGPRSRRAGSTGGRRSPPCERSCGCRPRRLGRHPPEAGGGALPRKSSRPGRAACPRGRRSRGSIDDVDEHPVAIPDRGGLDYRPERGDGTPAAADHLAGVVIGHVQLQHDRAVVLLERLHAHLVRTVDERPGEILEELLHYCAGAAGSGSGSDSGAGSAAAADGVLFACARASCFTVLVGWAPHASQYCRRSSSITIVEGSVCGL